LADISGCHLEKGWHVGPYGQFLSQGLLLMLIKLGLQLEKFLRVSAERFFEPGGHLGTKCRFFRS
jgi:hypothetical protein